MASNRVLWSEIRMPLVITTDATAATAGLKKAQGQLQGMQRQLGGWASGQIGQLGGMLGAYFGIDAAIAGLHKVKAEADRLQGLARQWSPAAATAGAKADIAEMQRDRAQGLATDSASIVRDDLRTKEAALAVAPAGLAASETTSAIGILWDQGLSAMSHSLKSALAGLQGDWQTMSDERALAVHRGAEMGLPQWGPGMDEARERGAELEQAALEQLRKIASNTQGAR